MNIYKLHLLKMYRSDFSHRDFRLNMRYVKGMFAKRLKITGMAILLLPIFFLSAFLFGETFGGDITGLIHLVQVLPLLLLLFLAWKWPKIVGVVLVVLGLVAGSLYFSSAHFPTQAVLLVEAVVFLPPVVAGIFLFLSAKKQITDSSVRKY